MSDMILMICKNCSSGNLVNIGDNLWLCENCGKKTLIKDDKAIHQFEGKQRPEGFLLSVSYEGKTTNFKVRENAEFEIAFDRRATMADPDPMNVNLTVDGRSRATYGHLPKTGKGTIVFEANGGSIESFSTGDATLVRSDGRLVDDQDVRGEYSIAGLVVKVGVEEGGSDD